MGMDAAQRQRVSALEYAQIIEGKRRDREYQDSLARKVAFFAYAPHTTKKGLKPTDLWQIGDEIAQGFDAERYNSAEFQSKLEIMREGFAAKGVKLIC